MKRIISLLIIVVMLASAVAYALPQEKIISVTVDGRKIEFDVPPRAENNRVLVPMRYIFESLGAEVSWIPEGNKIIATKGDITVHLEIGSKSMYRNDALITLDVPAIAVSGRTLVPVRAVSEALDALVEWIPETDTVKITSAPKEYVPSEYNYKELSLGDTQLLKQMYPDFYEMYAYELLFENMAEYPSDIAELIDTEDARLRIFADDVWNNMLSHNIINIQTESPDLYIFDIPDEVEINSLNLMEDYMAITDNLEMSAEYALDSKFVTTPGGIKLFAVYFKITDTTFGIPNTDAVYAALCENTFRYFAADKTTTGDVTENTFSEITKDGKITLASMDAEGNWSNGAKSHEQIIDIAMK